MQLTEQQTLPVGQLQAWEALNDIALLQSAIPGCEGITPAGDNQYEVLVLAAIGPVKAKFKGKLKLENLQPPNSYTLRFEGQGGAAGHGKGHADIRLEAAGAHSTVLHYTAHASVGGKIAQVGSRLVDMAAQKMATEFFESFNAKLAEKYGVAPAPTEVAAAPQGLFARLVAWFKRLFGG
ncbi:MAG: carbon monoxide dehydrogenase subunit G [Burkholderiales bacterium]|nr:carbon monoxide dehydrogenase subunit G [Burkholderiales bacterium]